MNYFVILVISILKCVVKTNILPINGFVLKSILIVGCYTKIDLFSPKCQMARHVATHLPMYVLGENKSDRFSGYQTRCNGRIVGKETQVHQIPNHMIHLHLKQYKDKYHAETGIKIPGRFIHK